MATIEMERDSLRTCNDRLQESLEMHTAQLAEIQTKVGEIIDFYKLEK